MIRHESAYCGTYLHVAPGREGRNLPWPYTMLEERVVPFHGRELLIVLCESTIGSACVGSGSLRHLYVPGYVIRLRDRRDQEGSEVSIVEPVRSDQEQHEIRLLLSSSYPGLQVSF